MGPKDIMTVAPSEAAIVASWLNLLEVTLSISLLSASLVFLIYRWWDLSKE